MNAHTIGVGFPCLYGYRCLAIPPNKQSRFSSHLSFCGMAAKREKMEKVQKLFKIAADYISEVIEMSGKLSKKGICEAMMFNSNIILNDAVLRLRPNYSTISDNYLVLLYYLVREQRKDLNDDELVDFINERMGFYSKEYENLLQKDCYTPIWVYSTFYVAPLEDEPKPCLDILRVMTFQRGLIRMACRVHEELGKELLI